MRAQSRSRRLVINSPELAELARGKTLAYTVGAQRIEIVLERMSIKKMILAILDATIDELQAAPTDPPEAREFLSRSAKR